MDYYFFCYSYGSGLGNNVIKQHQGPDGFNITEAHIYMEDRFQGGVVILYWCKITEKRFNEYMDKLRKGCAPKTPTLIVVPKDGRA